MPGNAYWHLAPLAWCAEQAQASGLAWLTCAEQSRLQGFATAHRKTQFLAGRWLLRQLLARTSGGAAWTDWPLSMDRHGAPSLLQARHHFHLSLSHSGDWLAAAVADTPIGIDIETTKPRKNLAQLSHLFFSAAECQEIKNLSEKEFLCYFYEVWTLKEAWLKYSSHGRETQPSIFGFKDIETHKNQKNGLGRSTRTETLTIAFALAAKSKLQRHFFDSESTSHLKTKDPVFWSILCSTPIEPLPPGKNAGTLASCSASRLPPVPT